jgi:hypothetical protein
MSTISDFNRRTNDLGCGTTILVWVQPIHIFTLDINDVNEYKSGTNTSNVVPYIIPTSGYSLIVSTN